MNEAIAENVNELDQSESEDQGIDNGAETKAREQGWTPQEDWHGDPDKWVGAQEFLERGEKHNGILRERNEKLFEEVSSLKQELRDSVRQFGEATRKAEERAYKQAIKKLQSQQIKAVEEGDTQAWKELENEKTSLQNEYNEVTKKPTETSPDQDPAFVNWHANNQWYNGDLDLTVYANQIAPIIANRYGNNPTPEFYEEIGREVRKKFPDKFRNTNRDRPSPVQGANQQEKKPSNKGKSYNDLPPEAKHACDRFVKQGVMTQEEYTAEYFSE